MRRWRNGRNRRPVSPADPHLRDQSPTFRIEPIWSCAFCVLRGRFANRLDGGVIELVVAYVCRNGDAPLRRRFFGVLRGPQGAGKSDTQERREDKRAWAEGAFHHGRQRSSKGCAASIPTDRVTFTFVFDEISETTRANDRAIRPPILPHRSRTFRHSRKHSKRTARAESISASRRYFTTVGTILANSASAASPLNSCCVINTISSTCWP